MVPPPGRAVVSQRPPARATLSLIPGQAKVPLAAGLFGIVRREAPAVVPHFKAQYLRAEVNVDLDAAPVGVFDRIGYGLAPDSERRILQ